MAYLVGVASQKGGVGKSTIARALAREFASGGLSVKIADLDTQQATSFHWMKRRAEASLTPPIRVESFQSLNDALREASQFDAYILDGAPHASRETRNLALKADMTIIPTGQSIDDLHPTVMLAHDLRKAGVDLKRIAIALYRVTDSEPEIKAARRYLTEAGYHVLPGEVRMLTGYTKASDQGRTITETAFSTLNQQSNQLLQGAIDRLAELVMETEAA